MYSRKTGGWRLQLRIKRSPRESLSQLYGVMRVLASLKETIFPLLFGVTSQQFSRSESGLVRQLYDCPIYLSLSLTLLVRPCETARRAKREHGGRGQRAGRSPRPGRDQSGPYPHPLLASLGGVFDGSLKNCRGERIYLWGQRAFAAALW